MQFLRIMLLGAIFINLALGADIIYIDYGSGELIQFNEESSTRTVRVTQPDMYALDMDWATQTIYYTTDTAGDSSGIYMVTVEGDVTKLMSDFDVVYSIALDWINNNLYFIHGDQTMVKQLNLDTLQQDVLHTEVTGASLQSIVVDPRIDQGYIYWSSVGQADDRQIGQLARAKLDGSEMGIYFESDTIIPTLMTIDLSDDYLYWVDYQTHMIFRYDLKGRNRVTPIDSVFLQAPYGITVYNGIRLLWTISSETARTINEIDLTNCDQTSCIVTPLDIPYDEPRGIKILDETQQLVPVVSNEPSTTTAATSDSCCHQGFLVSVILPVLLWKMREHV